MIKLRRRTSLEPFSVLVCLAGSPADRLAIAGRNTLLVLWRSSSDVERQLYLEEPKMDAWTFRRQVVAPNLEEMITDFGNIRLATNCILSIDAFAAHIFYLEGASFDDRDDSCYRERLAEKNNDFRILRDVAKGIKHCKLERGKPLISGSASLGSRGIGPFASGHWEDDAVWNDEARWNDGPGELLQVVVDLSDGKIRTLEAIALSAVDLLDQELADVFNAIEGRSR